MVLALSVTMGLNFSQMELALVAHQIITLKMGTVKFAQYFAGNAHKTQHKARFDAHLAILH